MDNGLELAIHACEILDGENEKLKERIAKLEESLLAHKKGWQASVERSNEIKAQAVEDAINACRYCGTDGESWRSELEQYAIKLANTGE